MNLGRYSNYLKSAEKATRQASVTARLEIFLELLTLLPDCRAEDLTATHQVE
jgi:hypothetical protein